jgi:hypothetical protein
MARLLFGPDGSALEKPEDVIRFLAEATHWKIGRSAYEAAQSWFAAQGLPEAIRDLIETDAVFSGAVLLKAVFEKQTPLGTPGKPSQTDVLAVLQTRSGPALLGIEAKVDEPFGEVVSEWNDHTPGKERRLRDLMDRLGLAGGASVLRYQLLHRTVATLIEAEQHGAENAAMVVQSFSPHDIRAGFADFQRFAKALGIPVDEPGRLSAPLVRGGIWLRLGWAQERLHVAKEAPSGT